MDLGVVSIIGIIVGLIVMIFLAYRGVSLLLCTPLAAVVVAAFSLQDPIAMLTGPYMAGFVGFAQNYFLLFMFSAMFGALMGATGCARGISNAITKLVNRAPEKNRKFLAILCITAISLILGYGGVNGFVIIYTTTAINSQLLKRLDIPWHLGGLATVASAVWVQGFLPGSPSIQNLIPTTFLGTAPTAGPVLGILCSILAGILWLFYCRYALGKAEKEKEGFFPTGTEIDKVSFDLGDREPPGILKSVIPSAVLLIVLNVIKLSPVLSLIIACAAAVILFWPALAQTEKGPKNVLDVLTQGALNSVNAVIVTCACVGFGGVVSAVSGYQTILNALTSIPGPPIFQFFIAVSVAAGATGSGSGGLTIALNSLGQRFLDMGINPQVLHRVGTMACCSLDTLPHNGAIVNSLMVSRLTHKQAYKHTFMISVVITTICSLAGTVLASMGIV
ncbi:hypothetical protein LJC04_05545 [Ruminococcaceae bacterium OttesenSCG-928-O06]|nr:hypothetical protein [Ruminococcaceae bacterium OttesenSCG-928-O06]